MTGRRSRGRARKWLYLAASAALLALLAAGWFWWDLRQWRPDEALYPEQGAAIDARHGDVLFDSIRAVGGRFVYIAASEGAQAANPRFEGQLAAAREAGLKVGAVHRFDPCARADSQSANFARIVPRDPRLLPPVVALEASGDGCAQPVSDAAIESELIILINQIERHAGRPVILRVAQPFEERYHLASSIERDLWLVRDRFPPRYASRPWLLWSANRAYDSPASGEPVEWVVVQR